MTRADTDPRNRKKKHAPADGGDGGDLLTDRDDSGSTESDIGDSSSDSGGGGGGEGCLGCLMLPFKVALVVIKGAIGLIVRIGDAFAGGNDD